MGKSKKIKGGFGTVFQATGMAAAKTVQHAVEVGDAAVVVAKTGVETVNEAVGVAKEGLIVGQKTAQLVGQVADSSKLITDESGKLTAKTLENLAIQVGNASDNLSEISNLSKESVKQLTPGFSEGVGYIGQTFSTLTNFINNIFTSGNTLITSISSVLIYPFKSIKKQIDDMETRKDDTSKSDNINKITNKIKAAFAGIRKNTIANFKTQIDNILGSIRNLEKIAHTACDRGYIYTTCTPKIKTLLSDIEIERLFLVENQRQFITIIEPILSNFDARINSIKIDAESDNYLVQLYNEASVIQSEVITEALVKFNNELEIFNTKIKSIELKVRDVLQPSTIQPSTEHQTIGGRKTNKRKTKKSKSKKSKTRKSKK